MPYRLSALLFIVMAAACGGHGGNTTPTTPTPAPVPSVPAPTVMPRPLGTAQVSDATCVATPGYSIPSGAKCRSAVVVCPEISSASARIRSVDPRAGVAYTGTIVLSTGGDGTNFYILDTPFIVRGMANTFSNDGLLTVEVAWDAPGIWQGPKGPQSWACRYATVSRWIYDNLHRGGSQTLFAGVGTSGGAAQIAFALSYYGVDSFFGLAVLSDPCLATRIPIVQVPPMTRRRTPTRSRRSNPGRFFQTRPT